MRYTTVVGLLILCSGTWVVAQSEEKAAPAKTDKQPAKTTPEVEPVAERELSPERLDEMAKDTAKLREWMSKAKNSLSRPGQQMLRQKVYMEQIMERAKRQADSFANDDGVKRFQELIASADGKNQLLEIAENKNEEEGNKQMDALFRENKVPLDALVKFAQYRKAGDRVAQCNTILQELDRILSEPIPDGSELMSRGSGFDQSDDQAIAAIVKLLASRKTGGAVDKLSPTAPNQRNPREMLKALLK